MHIAEGAFKHRSITQFGELTKAPSDHPPVCSAAPPSPAAKPAGALPHLTFSIAVSSSLSALRGHQALARRGPRLFLAANVNGRVALMRATAAWDGTPGSLPSAIPSCVFV